MTAQIAEALGKHDAESRMSRIIGVSTYLAVKAIVTVFELQDTKGVDCEKFDVFWVCCGCRGWRSLGNEKMAISPIYELWKGVTKGTLR